MKTLIALVLFASTTLLAQSPDKMVEAISKRYAAVAEKVRLCESDDEQGEYGELFMNELTVNTRSHQWRAVGIYGHKIRFFYDQVENDERRLYPDRLVFVKSERKSSNRTYTEEYLFSDKGDLIFYFQRAENDEFVPADRRFYFSAAKVVRVIEDSKDHRRPTANDAKTAAEILAASRRLSEIFSRSLKL